MAHHLPTPRSKPKIRSFRRSTSWCAPMSRRQPGWRWDASPASRSTPETSPRRRPGPRSTRPSAPPGSRRPTRCASGQRPWRGSWRGSTRSGGAVRLSHEPLDLETAFEFRIAVGGSKAHQNTLVRIEHEGIEGLGEAAPSHYYGERRALVEAAIAAWAPHLGDDPFALDAIDQRLDQALIGQRAARAAIESALHDWIGKRLGQPVWRLLGLNRDTVPHSCVTLGMASPEEMER